MTMERPSLDEYGVSFPRRFGATLTEKLTVAGIVAASASRMTPYILHGVETRGQLPDFIDIPNHIGNLSVTYAILYELNKGFWGRNSKLETPEEQKRSKRIAMGGTAVVALLANAFAEKYGYGGSKSVGDPLDFAYGCVGGYIAYKFAKPWYFTPEVVRDREENVPNGVVARTATRLKNAMQGEIKPVHDARPGAQPHGKKGRRNRKK